MWNDEMTRIDICGGSFPIRCDMVVLEKIQEEFGDVLDYEYAIRGVVPYFDPDSGLRIKDRDKSTTPNVRMVCRSLAWMIAEGIEVSGEELQAPTEKDIKQQMDMSITDLALACFREYSKCFLSRKGRSKDRRKDTNQNSSKAPE